MDRGQDKINQICELLKKDTIEPAKKDAENIVEKAKAEAAEIIKQAGGEADRIINDAKKTIEQKKMVFETALKQASEQSIAALKQAVEKELFDTELAAMLEKGSRDSAIAAKLINTIVEAIQKEGLGVDLAAYVANTLSADEVNQQLLQEVKEKLKQGSVELADFKGGAKVGIRDSQMTIDISDEALKEFFASFLRSDFRQFLFSDA